jgi:tRNA A-37 threonylcarbamoyl transferase component Bud32
MNDLSLHKKIDSVSFPVKLSFFSARKISFASGKNTDNDLLEIFKQVDRYFKSIEITHLKNGHSSTVIKITSGASIFVIRRDNFVNIAKFSRRIFRKSRSCNVWEKGQFLKSVGLNTINPLALIEDFCLGLRTRSYVVYEYIAGITLRDFLSDQSIPYCKIEETAKKVIQCLLKWHSLGITHGDPKAANVLIRDGNVFFIDTEDIKTPRTKRVKKHAIARDICILLHNLQKHQEIRNIWIRKLVLSYPYGLEYLGKRLIEKFWKDELEVFSRRYSKRIDGLEIAGKIIKKEDLKNWEPINTSRGKLDLFSKTDSAACSVSPRFFNFARLHKGYFSKPRVPQKGILSMALSLGICGFSLPGIIDGGVLDGHEYVFWEAKKGESVQSVWEAINSDPLKKHQLLTAMAEEIGRLHAMGFVGVLSSVHSIFIEKEKDLFIVGFYLNGSIRRPQWGGQKCFTEEIRMLDREFLSLIPARDASCFFPKYNEILKKA